MHTGNCFQKKISTSHYQHKHPFTDVLTYFQEQKPVFVVVTITLFYHL